MGYKWLPVTEDFDKSLVIKKWRFDVSIPISSNYDGALSELPNIDIKTCWNNSKPENGYAFSNRFNLGQKYFSSRYYGWADKYWTATTQAHTTLVSGTTYEFECPVDLYWAGNYSTPWNPNIPNYMWFYVETPTFEITPTESVATYESGTTTITVNTDNDSTITWTASTSDSWLSLSTLTGAGDGSVTVTHTENKTFQNRTGTVTFTSSEGDVLTFTIEQEKKPVIVYDHPIYRSGNLVKKMYRSGNLIYQRLNPGYPLPSNSFVFNFNAKQYDPTTRTIPGTLGQTLSMDMILQKTTNSTYTGISSAITQYSDHITFNEGTYAQFAFADSASSPFNLTSSTPNMTFIVKFWRDPEKSVTPGTTTFQADLLANRGNNPNSWNWLIRVGPNRYWMSTNTNNDSVPSGVTWSASPTVIVYRISNLQISVQNYTEELDNTPFTPSYKDPTNRVTFFGQGYQTTASDVRNCVAGDFYWAYLSREVLTDEEVQKVIDYNEKLPPPTLQ